MKPSMIQKALLACGICSPLLYLLTDIIAGASYPGYSFNQMAVSELFAIGAPTSVIVVVCFSISSLLFVAFARGIWLMSAGNRRMKLLAIMVLGNAINSLVLWNLFPMHMRGDTKTFTDTMHTILAINPFIHISIITGILMKKNWFRYYSILTLVLLFVPAAFSFSNISLLLAQKPTPLLGLTERIAVYTHQLWHAVLAVVLIRKYQTEIKPSIHTVKKGPSFQDGN